MKHKLITFVYIPLMRARDYGKSDLHMQKDTDKKILGTMQSKCYEFLTKRRNAILRLLFYI